MNDDKIKTTIDLDDDVFKSLKKVAIEKEVSQNQLMNDYIVQGLKNEEKIISKSIIK
ncbi:MAG: ribbon-helix-helix domain-containing protein [Methanobrevibacter sp.]|nr:ribbon-helix-helix domain-containing protein [Methanobrevibacter sp.]